MLSLLREVHPSGKPQFPWFLSWWLLYVTVELSTPHLPAYAYATKCVMLTWVKVIDLRQLRTCSSRVIREATVGPNVIFPARSWVAPVSLSSLQQWGRVNTDHTPSTVRFSGLGRPRAAQKPGSRYTHRHTQPFRTQPASVSKARTKRTALSYTPSSLPCSRNR